MNRRGFVFGGAVLGVISAGVALAKEAARQPGTYSLCRDQHEPVQLYVDYPAFTMSNGEKDVRPLVPCRKCGVLFAVPRKVQP
jgi:hypothetical protein